LQTLLLLLLQEAPEVLGVLAWEQHQRQGLQEAPEVLGVLAWEQHQHREL
jgi:hypothetical protein